MKHESFLCIPLVVMFAVFVCSALFPNCAGMRHRDTGESFCRDSYAAGKLEATVKELDRTTSDSRERIRDAVKASRSIEDGIERIEFLFGKYEQEVARLQNEIDRIRAQAECKEESSAYTMRNIACNDSRKDYPAIIKVQGNKSPLPARLVVVE